ncbi:MAG: hypothetical protein WCK27_01360 [Verrucomicrobiota bacterium]
MSDRPNRQRNQQIVENCTSAPPATTCGAMPFKRGKDRCEAAQAF